MQQTSQSVIKQEETPIDSFATSLIGVIKPNTFSEEEPSMSEETHVKRKVNRVQSQRNIPEKEREDKPYRKKGLPKTLKQHKIKEKKKEDKNEDKVIEMRNNLAQEKVKRQEDEKKKKEKEKEKQKEYQEQVRKLKDNEKKQMMVDSDWQMVPYRHIGSSNLQYDFISPETEFRRVEAEELPRIEQSRMPTTNQRNEEKKVTTKIGMQSKKTLLMLNKQETFKPPFKEKKEPPVFTSDIKLEKATKPVGSNYE